MKYIAILHASDASVSVHDLSAQTRSEAEQELKGLFTSQNGQPAEYDRSSLSPNPIRVATLIGVAERIQFDFKLPWIDNGTQSNWNHSLGVDVLVSNSQAAAAT
jgi:hypothetical protein